MKNLSFNLEPVQPFRLDFTVWALRRRPDNLVDRWDGRTYRRVLIADDGRPFEVAVSQPGMPAAAHLQVSIHGETTDEATKRQAVAALERLLGIRLTLDGFYRLADGDERLKVVADRFRGFKPPRYHSPFEALVNAMACQQLTLTMGIRLLNSLAETCGPAFRNEEGVFHAFPRPEDLANVDVENLRRLKFSYQKARYITGLARSIMAGELDLSGIDLLDDGSAMESLRRLPGVGRWTAEYFLLRSLGRTHVFPADDVGARNHLQRWLELPGKMNYDTVHEALEPWKDHGGLVYFHLLLKSLAEKSMIVV